MAAEGEEQRMSLDPEEDQDDSSSSTENGDSDEEEEEIPPVEWLATGREKRSTAGNRMKSMLAAEEPDDELELLFAEDGDDAGFTDVDDDGSDVHMDSSSDDEDAQDNADADEGEKELEKQARENRQAARKRKAQEAIPMKFRKKVKITPTVVDRSTAAPEPRPKKKSERTSWLPSPLDAPTRASKRETTMMSKEQLHQQMIEREVKRLKQVAAMERKAKKMEALKKPPMTQAERLAEAALVEKRNAKSLNRWEEAEKLREEERRAKLAALNNRKLNGPVVTFWSGVGEWIDGKLKHVGKIITIEEKPLKKKRASAVATGEPSETPGTEESAKEEQAKDPTHPTASTSGSVTIDKSLQPHETPQTPESAALISKSAEVNKPLPPPDTTTSTTSMSKPAEVDKPLQTPESTEKPDLADTEAGMTLNTAPRLDPQEKVLSTAPTVSEPAARPQRQEDLNLNAADLTSPETKTLETKPLEGGSPEAKAPEAKAPEMKPPETKPLESKPAEMKPPDMRPPNTSIYTTSMFAPTPGSQLMKPPEMKPPHSNSFLAPPQGVTHNGLSMPMLGYSSTHNKTSNVLAPPNTTQSQSPPSMPQAKVHPPPVSTPPPPPSKTPPAAPVAQTPAKPPSKPLSSLKASQTNASKKQACVRAPSPPPPPPPPPPDGKATRNCIILQNFDENAVSQKAVQQHILFGKEMSKLAKPAPAPRCIITNRPARYKDPKTGLPYYNLQAFKEIQKLQRGEYKWSRLVGAWVGSGSFAAQGVPARFLDPNAPAPPPKKAEAKPAEPASDAKQEEESANKIVVPTTPSNGSVPPTHTPSAPSTAPRATGTPTKAAPTVVAPTPTHTISTGTGPPINT